MDTTALADEPTVATDTPPTWSELLVQRLAAESDLAERSGVAENPEAAERTAEQGGPSWPEPPALDRWWLLVAPLTGAVALSAASVLFEPNPLQTGTSPSGLLAFAVLIPFFLLCVAGTLALVRDATLLRAAETDWSPNPRRYVVPSAVLLTAIRSYPVVQTAGRVEGLVGFLVGTFVVALAAASILAGPAYLYRRRNRVARD